MSIIFTVICRDYDKILCEYTEYQGNFQQITMKILQKSKKSLKATITYDEANQFHFITNDNVTFMCLCEKSYPIEIAFEFLDSIREEFESTFTKEQIASAYAFSFNNEFRSVLSSKMEKYNKTLTSQIEKLKTGIKQTNTILLSSGDLLGQRGEKLQLIVKKADSLKQDSEAFYDKAKKMKQRAKSKRIRLIIMFIILIIAIYCVFCFYCDGLLLDKCLN